MESKNEFAFSIGDVVSLKVNPETKGVIELFCTQSGSTYKKTDATIVTSAFLDGYWAFVSILKPDYKTELITVPVSHLKHE